MKITKKIREHAALICAIAASNLHINGTNGAGNWVLNEDRGLMEPDPVELEGARWLATLAFEAAYDHDCTKYTDRGGQDWQAQMAEAEAMLRCGWRPGEP